MHYRRWSNSSNRRALAQQLGNTLEASRKASLVADPDAITVVRRVLVTADGTERPIPSDDDHRSASNAAVRVESPAPLAARVSDDPRSPAVPTICRYCHQSPTRCLEIKDTRLDAWRALHFLDPEEV